MSDTETYSQSNLSPPIGRHKPQLQLVALAAVLAGLIVAAGLAGFASLGALGAACGLFALITALAARGLNNFPHSDLGWCNAVTLMRCALIACLAGAIVQPDIGDWVIFSIALVAFSMDGLDGWLARHKAHTSDFGARFDMEADALFAAVLSIVILRNGDTGPEILLLGFMRYAFVLAGLVIPALTGTLPPSMRRKTVCVVQISALLLLIFPPVSAQIALPVAIIAAGLLVWSFAVDTIWLLRAAR